MNIIEKPAPTNDYFQEAITKTGLVLHFTAGYTAEGARVALDKEDHVSVGYIVDLNGDVWHRFDRKFWGYHLGMTEYNQGHAQDKRTIAIEIVNIGPVWHKDGVWKDYVGGKWDESKVAKVPYHGADGMIKFPEAQMVGICDLVGAILSKEPNIAKSVPQDKLSYLVPKICSFSGVMCHTMFRKDKYDMGTSFDWQRLIKTCGLTEVSL